MVWMMDVKVFQSYEAESLVDLELGSSICATIKIGIGSKTFGQTANSPDGKKATTPFRGRSASTQGGELSLALLPLS